MTYAEAIAKRIKMLYTGRKITVNRLADLSGLTQSSVASILNGKSQNPQIKTLHKLANGLNMTVSEFLDFPEMNETIFEDD